MLELNLKRLCRVFLGGRATALFGLAVCSLVPACGGGEFRGAAGHNDAGSDSGPPMGCRGSADCDDRNPCTVDTCGADSTCDHAPRCGPSQKCCPGGSGTCGECCSNADCGDGIDCTVDTCSEGTCTHLPSGEKCTQPNQYCAPLIGCRFLETCTGTAAGECDDGDICTTDACLSNLCQHKFCDIGMRCCPGSGCAQCCTNLECDDRDPCTVDSCSAGQCQHTAKCGVGTKCCPSSDQSAAFCGTNCCDASECNDQVACTVDSCAAGTCSHATTSSLCGSGQVCDATRGCITPVACNGPAQCNDNDPCTTDICTSGGTCTNPTCSNGLRCCAGVGCRACCSPLDCNDSIDCTVDACGSTGTCTHTADNSKCVAPATCDPRTGCLQCSVDADCNDYNLCTTDKCVSSTCQHAQIACFTGFCCPDTGVCSQCCSDFDCGGITTQSSSTIIPINSCCCNGMCQSCTILCPITI